MLCLCKGLGIMCVFVKEQGVTTAKGCFRGNDLKKLSASHAGQQGVCSQLVRQAIADSFTDRKFKRSEKYACKLTRSEKNLRFKSTVFFKLMK